MLSKNLLRQQARETRNRLDIKSMTMAAERIHAQLLGLDAIRETQAWFIYVSFGNEVGTHTLIRELLTRSAKVTVPLIVGSGQMIAQQIRSLEELRPGEFGFLAPPPGEPFTGAIDVCLCPGLAFSEQGDRLGSGRGYYDRYLAVTSPRVSIGLAFDCQIMPQLPVELHDRRMDYVITENRVIHVERASR